MYYCIICKNGLSEVFLRIGDLHLRPNYNLDKRSESFYQSGKEDFKISKIANLRCEMFIDKENIVSQILQTCT